MFSKQRLLKEHQPNAGETCFACNKEGRRSYYCDTMITVAQTLSSFLNQSLGGQKASQTIFCSCCWLYHMKIESKRQRDYAKVSGWFTHPRNMCKYKDSCELKPESEIAKMPRHELRARLMNLELIHEDEGKKKETETRPLEIVSEGGPEKKTRKKEKKDEEEKKKKETQRKEEEKKRQAEEAAQRKMKKRKGKKQRSLKNPFGEKQQQCYTATCLIVATAAARTKWSSKRNMKNHFRMKCSLEHRIILAVLKRLMSTTKDRLKSIKHECFVRRKKEFAKMKKKRRKSD